MDALVHQVAGQQYALVVQYPDGPGFVDNAWPLGDWVGAQDNPYAGGAIVYSNDNGANWTSVSDSDLPFQPFVIAD